MSAQDHLGKQFPQKLYTDPKTQAAVNTVKAIKNKWRDHPETDPSNNWAHPAV